MLREDWKGNDRADREAKKGVTEHGSSDKARTLVNMVKAVHITQCRILMRICGGEERKPDDGGAGQRSRAPNRAVGRFIRPRLAEEMGHHRIVVGIEDITCVDREVTRKGLNKGLWAKFPCNSQRGKNRVIKKHEVESRGNRWHCTRCRCEGVQ